MYGTICMLHQPCRKGSAGAEKQKRQLSRRGRRQGEVQGGAAAAAPTGLCAAPKQLSTRPRAFSHETRCFSAKIVHCASLSAQGSK